MKTFEDWSEYLYYTLIQKINNIIYIKDLFIFNKIFSNKNFSIKFLQNKFKVIDYDMLSYNQNITLEYIIHTKHCNWNNLILNKTLGKNILNYDLYEKYKYYLEKYYNFNILYELYETWENILFIEKKFNHIIKYDLLSMNNNITWNIILNNIDKNWNFENLVINNENITIDIILNNISFFNEKCIKVLSKNKTIKWLDIIKHPEIIWNFQDLSLNKNITFDIVLNNLDKKWCFNRLSSNPNINIDIINNYNQFNWSIYWYSFNPNLRLDDIDKIKFKNSTKDLSIIINNLFLNNYDIEREQFLKKYNIINNKILSYDNFELYIY